MNFTNTWSLATASYGLAGFASLGLFLSILRRAPKSVETRYLLATILSLALHYGGVTADALLRASLLPQPRHTFWYGAGATFLVLFWASFCLFLLAVVRKQGALETVDKFNVGVAKFFIGVMLLGKFVVAVRAAYAGWSGASSAVVQDRLAVLAGQIDKTIFVVPIIVLGVLVRRIAKSDRTPILNWLAGEVNLTTLGISPSPLNQQSAGTAPLALRDFFALSGIVVAGAAVLGITRLQAHDSTLHPVAVLFLHLSLLASVMGLIYYQARFAFFDILLKRGLLFVLLALCIGASLYLLATFEAAPGGAAFAIFATLFVWFWTRFSAAAGPAIDRIFFRRPDYRRELPALAAAMARCNSVDELEVLVPARLRDLMRTESASYGPEPRHPASAVVGIGAGGYLSLGVRDRGQPYGSEDLTFLDAVASQFAARRAEQLAATAELRALRAQINPHFLFNTLNTVAAMAKSSPEIERTILNLARVFRNALDASRRERISLTEELAGVRAFLEIEAVRFEEKLRFEITAPPELLDAKVPPLLIQPLVENAVKHGIGPKRGGGMVKVRVEKAPHGLRVSVIDDGVGFDFTTNEPNVGLSNVQARVEREGGLWTARSTPGEGTTISFELKCES
jgi:signal transduction histidine kinase